MKHIIKKVLHTFGYDIIKIRKKEIKDKLRDFNENDWEIVNYVKEYTRTPPERVLALKKAMEYIVSNNIPGDIVECGVWRGGNIMAMAKILNNYKDYSRNIYLYDTFEGMSEPSENDFISETGEKADSLLQNSSKEDNLSVWCYAGLEDVKNNVAKTNYPIEKFKFIKGRVEETIPGHTPEQISLLRLDTDWYESTKHELIHLFPKLIKGGVLIIDDYGHWEGAKLAVDEYIKENDIQILLNRIDYSSRIAVKL